MVRAAVAGHPIVENVLAGYNSSIFAYGQTGAGKTYTMIGQLGSSDQVTIHITLHVIKTYSHLIYSTASKGSHGNFSLCISACWSPFISDCAPVCVSVFDQTTHGHLRRNWTTKHELTAVVAGTKVDGSDSDLLRYVSTKLE